MSKESLLKMIASKGYDIFYGANINFATYDMYHQIPKFSSILSITVGVCGLVWPTVANLKLLSVFVLLLGVGTIYMERFSKYIDSYQKRGTQNTASFNELKLLYLDLKNLADDNEEDINNIQNAYNKIVTDFNNSSQPDQMMFAGWFAHYKIFWQKDYHWMDEQLNFKFWKDKIPATLKRDALAFLIIVVICFIFTLCHN